MKNLLVLYVNVEQETAIHNLFFSRSWEFFNHWTNLSQDLKDGILTVARDTDDLPKNCCGTAKAVSEIENGQMTVVGGFGERTGDKLDRDDSAIEEDCVNSKPLSAEVGNKKEELKESEESETNESRKSTRVLRSRSKIVINKSMTNFSDRALRKESEFHNKKIHDKRTECQNEFTSKSYMNQVFTESKYNTRSSHRSDNIDAAATSEDNELVNYEGEKSSKCKISDEEIDKKMVKIKSTKEDKSNNIIIGNHDLDPKTDKKFKCIICNYGSNIKGNFHRHVKEMHSGIKYECSVCEKLFKSKHEARKHEMMVHSESLMCNECDKSFSSVSGLRNHIKIIHKKRSLYKCKHCDKKFFYKSHYLGHVNKHLGVKPFACEKCDQPFRYKVARNLHQKNCRSENYFTTHNPDGSKKTLMKKKYLCDVCGESNLSSKSSLKMHHFHTHTDGSQCVCSLCGKTVKGIYSLRRHMKTQHETASTRYQCTICDRSFSQRQILKQHMRIHNKEYSCFCDTCGKGFLSQFKLKEHARVHSGEKPFTCAVCNTYKSATKTNLQKHMKTHSKERLQRPRQKKRQNPKEVLKNSKSAGILGSDSTLRNDSAVPDTGHTFLEPSGENFLGSNHSHEVRSHYTLLPGMSMENTHSTFHSPNYDQIYHMTEPKGHSGDRGQGRESLHDEGHSHDLCDHEAGYQSNELSEGLNILTIAMNIVNPEQY